MGRRLFLGLILGFFLMGLLGCGQNESPEESDVKVKGGRIPAPATKRK
jgi:hypothetical protein